jgi:hypothetical protein
MNIIIIILVALVVTYFLMEWSKHNLQKNLMKYVIVAIFFVIGLLILSAYIDLGSIFGQGSTFSNTGNVIVDNIEDNTDKFNPLDWGIWDTINEKGKEILRKVID